MPGWRLGWAVVPKKLQDNFLKSDEPYWYDINKDDYINRDEYINMNY